MLQGRLRHGSHGRDVMAASICAAGHAHPATFWRMPGWRGLVAPVVVRAMRADEYRKARKPVRCQALQNLLLRRCAMPAFLVLQSSATLCPALFHARQPAPIALLDHIARQGSAPRPALLVQGGLML